MGSSQFCQQPTIRKGVMLLFACCWISGVACGVFCYSVSSPVVTSLMHRIRLCSASIVGLMNAALIPFLLSALFTAFSMSWMLPGLCFAKAFLSSFVSAGVLVSYGSGGWLVRYFLLFCDCAALPLLYWYWSKSATPEKQRWFLITGSVFLALALVTFLDYRVIAPIVCLIDSMKG